MLSDEAASENSNATEDALDVTHIENTVLKSADEHDVVLDIKAAAECTRSGKQNATFKGSAFYLYAASLFQSDG